MQQRPLIAMVTDFGNRDWFVASMKGIILATCPQANIVDISHEVSPGDIGAAAFILANCYATFPAHTIFLGVVDPGVGTLRKPLIIRYLDYFFVGPDNGLFTHCLTSTTPYTAWCINAGTFQTKPISTTFHGRDLFAPAAATLACDTPPASLGTRVNTIQILGVSSAQKTADGFIGSIQYIDRFGNGISNIRRDQVEIGSRLSVSIAAHTDIPVVECYAHVPAGQPCAVWNSSNFLEIAIHAGDAQSLIPCPVGTSIHLHIESEG